MSASAIRKHGQILLEDLPPFYTTADQNHGNRNSYYAPDIYNPVDDEKNEIINTLRSCRGNRRKAAKKLNIGEATLYRKIKKYKITKNNTGG
jgi:transcriptional regulator of acetoin/glycerol metabolism